MPSPPTVLAVEQGIRSTISTIILVIPTADAMQPDTTWRYDEKHWPPEAVQS